MSSKTKIVVLRMKEIIYTAIFLGLGILLITLGLIMFRPKKEAAETSGRGTSYIADKDSSYITVNDTSYVSSTNSRISSYIPGVYTSSLTLGSQNVNLEVTVDSSQIKSIVCTPVSESVETMYPLITPAASSIAEQIVATQSMENLNYPEGSYYTSQAVVKCVERALEKAAVK